MAKPSQDYQPDPVTMVAYHRALAEHADGLKAYATRLLGDQIAAEDVAQDSFLALYRHLNQVPTAAYRPWLFRVARNLCLDQLRRRKFKLSLFRDLQKDEEQPFTPADSDAFAQTCQPLSDDQQKHDARCADPHEDPRRQPGTIRQKDAFFRPDGRIIDPCPADSPCKAVPRFELDY